MDRLDEPEPERSSESPGNVRSGLTDSSSSSSEDSVDENEHGGSGGSVVSSNEDDDLFCWESSSSSSIDNHNDEIRSRLESNDPTLTSLIFMNGFLCRCSSPLHGSTHSFHPNFSYESWEEDGAIIGKNTHIEEIEFIFYYYHDIPDRDDFKIFFQGLSRNQSIQTLTFRGSTMFDGMMFTALTPFFKNNPNFHCLSFIKSNQSNLDADETHALASALSSFDTLRDFRMAVESVDKKARAKLIDALVGHSKLKALKLSRKYLAADGILPLVAFLKNTTCDLADLTLNDNQLVDGDVVLLADALTNFETLTHLDLSGNKGITEVGWKCIADLLTNNTTRLESLSINLSSMDNSTTISLVNTLTQNNMALKRLEFSSNTKVGTVGWGALFTLLESPNCVMENLCLYGNGFTDETAISLARSLSANSTLRNLDLSCNDNVTVSGWMALANALGNPNVILEKLDIRLCKYSEIRESASVFANSLITNRTLSELVMFDYSPPTALDGWDALQHVLCNNSGIMDTFFSNHTLQKVWKETRNCPGNLSYLLNLNKNNNKFEVARQKIIDVHFTADVNIQPFVDIELNVLPHAFAWLAKDFQVFSFLYRLVRSMPPIFENAGGTIASNSPRIKKLKK